MSATDDAPKQRPQQVSRDTGEPSRFIRRDLYLLVYIPSITLFAWLLPERLWWPFARELARLSLLVKRKTAIYRANLMRQLGGRHLEVDVDEVARAHVANNHLRYLQGMRCYAPCGWQPRIRMDGREHIERALAAGKGAILWVAPMASRDLIAKIALHEAGFRVSHLSRYTHGFSRSLFGARVFNPIWTRIEERYLAERLVMTHAHSAGPLRTLVQRLKENRLVSVSVVEAGLHTPDLPFLDGTIRISEGAPALTVKTGAALLPIFVVRQDDGSYIVKIDPPLQPPASVTGNDAIRALFSIFLRQLETYALRYPTQYLAWNVKR
jgi:lauroyl/myristoyl acyltransferase